jgi:hypothetical protein
VGVSRLTCLGGESSPGLRTLANSVFIAIRNIYIWARDKMMTIPKGLSLKNNLL